MHCIALILFVLVALHAWYDNHVMAFCSDWIWREFRSVPTAAKVSINTRRRTDLALATGREAIANRAMLRIEWQASITLGRNWNEAGVLCFLWSEMKRLSLWCGPNKCLSMAFEYLEG